MTDFNDFVVAATEASTAIVVPAVVDGSTATRKMTVSDIARQMLDDATAPAVRQTLDAAPRVLPVIASATDPSSFDWAANADVFSWTFNDDGLDITPSNVPTVVGATRVALVQSGGGTPPHALSFTGATVYPASDAITVTAGTITKVVFETTGAGAYTVKQRGSISDIYGLQAALDLKAPLASPTFTGTVTVPDASFANAKLATMAQDTIKLRKTASTGAPEDGTAAEARTIIEKSPNSVLTSVSGSLTTATHNGKILVTSGNVTVPNASGDVGFSAIIIAGGAHTVTFNSTVSAAMAAGDVMTVIVQSTTVIKAVLTAAANLVSFS